MSEARGGSLIHDPALLDQLGSREPIIFEDEVFRATRLSLDPLTPSTSGGRWAPRGGPAALYTSLQRDGALAELVFHWMQLTPMPSKPAALHTLRVGTQCSLRLLQADLVNLGVDRERYEETDYARTQEIGAAVAFLECDGLLVPSARWRCENLVLFTDVLAPDALLECVGTEEVAWREWAREHDRLDEDEPGI